MADVHVSLKGVHDMKERLRKFKRLFPKQLERAVRFEMEIEATEAKKRTPVYVGPTGPGKPIPGVLRASVHVEGPEWKGRTLRCEIVAGGAAGAYAIPQHENLEFHHEVGQAKFIESVLMESRDHMLARIASHIDVSEAK